MKTKLFKWLWIALFGLTGCYDYSELDNIAMDQFSPSFVFPVVKSKITFKELAERSGSNTIVEQRPGSNMYYLVFRDTIDIGLASDRYTIPPTTFNNSFQLAAGVIPPIFPAGLAIGPITQDFNQSFETVTGSEIKRIDLSGGTLQIQLTNNFFHSIQGSITLTSLKNSSNAPVSINFDLPNNGSTFNNTINLNGYYLDLMDAPATYNNFKYSLTATITSSGNPSIAGDIAIQLSMSDINFQKIIGKVNQSFDHLNQPYTIDVFKSSMLANQHIAEPKLSLNFINSFGLPCSVNFTRLEVENNQGTKISIVNEGVPQAGDMLVGTPNNINYITGNQQNVSTPLVLNHINSNIENVFDVAPRTLSFGATFNLGDATDNHDYFIRNDSKFQLLSQIEFPLLGWVVTNEITDTISDMDWPDLKEDFGFVDDGKTKITFKFKFGNELPLDIFLQADFLDDAGVSTTQLFDSGSEWFIKSAPVSSNGESSGSTEIYSYINIDKAKYDLISKSTKTVLVYKFKTGGADNVPPQNITILSTNSIAINMSLEISGTVKP